MIVEERNKWENIAEYLLCQWQMEDMIRAAGFDMPLIRRTIIEGCDLTADGKEGLMRLYEDAADRMRSEGVAAKGHLRRNTETLDELTALHSRLVDSPSEEQYRSVYFQTLPFIIQLRAKSGGKSAPEIETCFTGVYGYLMLRVQQKEVGDSTVEGIRQISALLTALSVKYKEIYVESNTEKEKGKV
ncbi:MAG: DUF4924 family protein [Tannerellaceae bacterium]|jgi:hypothetical protein|nr:DUF4924 family protein [Tannerellaceae bacterium]